MSDETKGTASQPAEGASEPVASEPVNLEAPAAQTETTGQTTQEGDQPAEQASDKPEGETPEQQTERKRLSGAQKAKRRETFLLNQLAERDRELEVIRQASQRTEGTDDKAPEEKDFPDWGDYIAAKAAYRIKQDRKAEERTAQTTKAQAEQAGVWRERIADHQERVEELKETVKDFDQVIKSAAGISIREELGAEIVSSEKSAQLQYYLAKNQDKLHHLNSLTGRELAKEIGRLEATLTLPKAKTQTAARPPLSRLSGGAGPAIDLAKADMETYVAERKKQGFGQR
jgi:hypothetical protein